ncbi:MAG: type II toxin-antitoxin system VapC family toxin [Prevotellaceae bacterium]|jgi:PIN domain nuclease of toxin-antitoxin system|nr:type II toxin-antitoxin system VapC family toxin [Prevotellaceae bacterium]
MDCRHLLDTNIVLFFLFDKKELDRRVRDILDNRNNLFYISTASVQEIIHLYNGGKFQSAWKKAEDILPSIEAVHFELLPVKRAHLAAYATLSTLSGHNDPNDHIIISQAIAERMMLISSDRKFDFYTRQKLDLIFNNR